MSKTMVIAPINKAMYKAEDILGPNRQWKPINETQELYVYEYLTRREELKNYSDEELRAWASWIAAELNKILADEGFDISLDDFGPDEFGVVSILDVMVNWIAEGQVDQLFYKDQPYPAVKMEPFAEVDGNKETVFSALASSKNSEPIALVHTKSGDQVCMTIADQPLADFRLVDRIDNIRANVHSKCSYDWLKFPMVDLNHETDISWLVGMHTKDKDGGPWAISKALQQTKFKMNQYGARVKSAVAISFERCAMPARENGLKIDKPFYLWIVRPSIATPIMYAYIDTPDWKDPGDLGDM